MRQQRQDRLCRDFLKYAYKCITQSIYAQTIKKTKRVVLIIRKESFLRILQVMLQREVPAIVRRARKLLRLFQKRQEYMFITR